MPNRGMNKMWYIRTVEDYTVIKRNERLLYAPTRMDTGSIRHDEVS